MKAELGRDAATGRYVHTADRPCVCGHAIGVHTAASVGGERPCIAGDFDASIDCACTRYRPSRKAVRS